MNDRELDARLREWAAAQAPDRRGQEALAGRICAEARRRGLDRYAEPAPPAVPVLARLRYAGLGALAAAAAILLVLRWPSVAPDAADPAALAGISEAQLRAGGRLFEEVGRLFPDNLRWIAQAGSDVGIGTETRAAVPATGEPLLVRVTILSRAAGEDRWTQSWASELILRGQDWVEVVPDRRADNALALWVYPLEDGKLALDTTVRVNLPVRLSARLSAVAEPGRPLEIAALREDGTEYRVFQVVSPLRKGKG